MWICRPQVLEPVKVRLVFGDTNGDIDLQPIFGVLYDTEVIPVHNPPSEMPFFQRPLSQNMAYGGFCKSYAETNLCQAASLSYPEHFIVQGLSVQLTMMNKPRDATGDHADKVEAMARRAAALGPDGQAAMDALVATGYIELTGAQGQIAKSPLQLAVNWAEKFGWAAAVKPEKLTRAEGAQRAIDLAKGKTKLPLVTGNCYLIQPAEMFSAKVRWPNGAPDVPEAVRMQVQLIGIHYPVAQTSARHEEAPVSVGSLSAEDQAAVASSMSKEVIA